MTAYVAVLPSIHLPWTDRCLASCALDPILVVDNTTENRGVAASWNLGLAEMRRRRADWLIIVSAACRFGSPGGLDLIDHLENEPTALAVEAAHGIGWHLIAFHRRAFDAVGRFDENFLGYLEDVDFGRRILCKLGEPPWWPKVSVDVAIAGFAHGIELGGATIDGEAQEAYYRAKWNGKRGEEGTCHPFGRFDVGFWPTPPDPRSIIPPERWQP